MLESIENFYCIKIESYDTICFQPLHHLIQATFGPHTVKTLEVIPGRRFPVKEKTSETPHKRLTLRVFECVSGLFLVIPIIVPATIIGTVCRYSSRVRNPQVAKQVQLVKEWLKHQKDLPIPSMEWGLSQGEPKSKTGLNQTLNIAHLPKDVFIYILKFASPQLKDTVNVSLVSKQWRTVVGSPEVWKGIASRFPEVNLKSNVHCKEQIQTLFREAEGEKYPDVVLKLFGGSEKLLQIPVIKLPEDAQTADYLNGFDTSLLGNHPIARFTDEHGRHMIGIHYVRNVPLPITLPHNQVISSGSYEGFLFIFQRFKDSVDNWWSRDTFSVHHLLLGGPLPTKGIVFKWMEKFISGRPCGLLKQNVFGRSVVNIVEEPAKNMDGKIAVQLWKPEVSL